MGLGVGGEEAVEFAISSGGLFCNIYVFMLQTYSSHTDVSNVVGHLAYDFLLQKCDYMLGIAVINYSDFIATMPCHYKK